MHRSFFSLILAFALGAGPLARAADGSTSTHASRGPMTKIVFSGLAGATLGLSTLSFYGRPQDKLNNIAIGFALGAIFGVVYTTYQAATEPKEFFGGAERAADRWALLDNPRFTRPSGLLACDFSF